MAPVGNHWNLRSGSSGTFCITIRSASLYNIKLCVDYDPDTSASTIEAESFTLGQDVTVTCTNDQMNNVTNEVAISLGNSSTGWYSDTKISSTQSTVTINVPEEWVREIPDNTYGIATVTCVTRRTTDSVVLGTSTAQVYAYVPQSERTKPVIGACTLTGMS